MGELWIHASTGSLSPPLLPLWINQMQSAHLACIKLSTKMKCKCSNTWLISFPPQLFFFFDLSHCWLVYFVLLIPATPPNPFNSSIGQAQIRAWTAGGATRDNASEQTNLFPRSSRRLHLRAHERAPIEPLKPLFPNMNERKQPK